MVELSKCRTVGETITVNQRWSSSLCHHVSISFVMIWHQAQSARNSKCYVIGCINKIGRYPRKKAVAHQPFFSFLCYKSCEHVSDNLNLTISMHTKNMVIFFTFVVFSRLFQSCWCWITLESSGEDLPFRKSQGVYSKLSPQFIFMTIYGDEIFTSILTLTAHDAMHIVLVRCCSQLPHLLMMLSPKKIWLFSYYMLNVTKKASRE